MTNKKLTKKDHFTALLALAEAQNDQTLIDFINHELELLSKKNTSVRSINPEQLHNRQHNLMKMRLADYSRRYNHRHQ